MNPIELTVIPHPHIGSSHYMACWPDDEPGLTGISESDLAPFVAARFLLSQGYNPQQLLIVRGADYELLRAPLGAAAAMPMVNATGRATRSILHRSQHGG